VGFEAADPNQLKIYGKEYDRAKAVEQARLMREMNINLDICFIMYYPYSTIESTRRNLDFIRDMQLGHLVNKLILQLCGFSDIHIEKKFVREKLVQRESTYRSMGIYKFKHAIMDRLNDSLTRFFRQYTTAYFDLRDICYWSAVEDQHHPGIFRRCLSEMTRFGLYTLELYEYLLQAHEKDAPEILEKAEFSAMHRVFERMMFAIIDSWGDLVPCIRHRTNKKLER
jgi:radical SAM superfamily enzyme YgiQ (UPF0313 family)